MYYMQLDPGQVDSWKDTVKMYVCVEFIILFIALSPLFCRHRCNILGRPGEFMGGSALYAIKSMECIVKGGGVYLIKIQFAEKQSFG